MRNKTTRFLYLTLVIAVLLCVGIFTYQTVVMSRECERTINKVGEIYMEGMSEQITLHFGTIMELRLSQVEALVHDITPDYAGGYDEVCAHLASNARARSFDRLAFCLEDGTFELVYGDGIAPVDPAVFVDAIQHGQERIALGTDAGGDNGILLSVPMSYAMPDGRAVIALTAGFPVDFIADSLEAELSESMVDYIIRRDGRLVMQGDGEKDQNYFDKLKRHYASVEHHAGAEEALEEYIAGLQAAMAEGRDYTREVTIMNDRRQLYCKSLPYSEWYLILSMPYNELDQSIDQLNDEWAVVDLRHGILIILLFMTLFAVYFYMISREMHNVEEARRAAEHASRAKSEFLSNMSHDIRTPMNGIMGMAEIALYHMNDTVKVRECLQMITVSGKQLLGLISDVLDMSKIESGRMILNVEQTSLPEVMQNVVNIMQPQMRDKKQRFDLHIQDILAENVWCDSVRLNQILVNMLGNAVKYTPEGGKIQLQLNQTASAKGENYVRVHLRVTDNGIGMSAEFQKRIFESFMREDNERVQKTQGAGLGMSITKYIVDAMEGEIQVRSEQGKGSEFHVILDMERAPALQEEMQLPAWRTLVIDDDPVFCDCTIAMLRSVGIDAQSALDGEAALQALEERHQKGNDYEVVLLDWKLPEMDGIEVAREIRSRYGSDPRMLMISAYDNGDVEERAKQAGVDAFIVKPLFKSTLYYNLHQFMQEAGEETAEEITFNGERILVAEDNDLNWEIANALLSDLGLSPEHAENGKVCVDKFSQSYAGYYGAILMDLRMPVMTGFEAAKAIRGMKHADAKSIPIIAMSADAFADDVQKCLDCGMNAHSPKPMDVGKVARLLKKYMRV